MKMAKSRGMLPLLSLAALFVLFALFAVPSLPAASAEPLHNVTAYFFYGDGCPHCARLEPLLAGFEKKYSELSIVYMEVWKNQTNEDYFMNMSEAYGGESRGVPTLFLGAGEPIVGYRSGTTDAEIEGRIQACLVSGCIDPADRIKNPALQDVTSGGTSTGTGDKGLSAGGIIIITVIVVVAALAAIIILSGKRKIHKK
jgi:thiol-disulfide isomerase/thioredoxin